jgi:hypothetical protein
MHCVIHIGGMKTGTTSIQRFCGKRRDDVLAPSGFWYPRAFARANEHLHRDLSSPGQSKGWKASIKAFRLERTAALESGAKVAVFSSEFFQLHNPDKARRLRRFLGEYFDSFRIVYYARRQDLLLAALHSTEVRASGRVTATDPMAVYERRGQDFFDHFHICETWSDAFGEGSVTARIFETDRLVNKDVVSDFASVIGLTLPENHRLKRANGSMSLEATSALIHLNASDERENKPLRRAIITGDWMNGERDIPMMDRKNARKFALGFDACNAKFFTKYVDPAHATAFARGFTRFARAVPAVSADDIQTRIEKARANMKLKPHELPNETPASGS